MIFPTLLYGQRIGFFCGFESVTLFHGAVVPRIGELKLISRRMEEKELLCSALLSLRGRLSLRVGNEIIK